MSLSQQLRTQWQQSREQIATNPRLGWGLWCLLLILLVYGNLVLRDNRDILALDLQTLQQRASELSHIGASSDWPERLAQAKTALTKQNAYFGEAESEALARADVQANVNSLLVATGLERNRIEVSAAPAVDATTGLIPLQLRLSGQARGEQLLTLLGGLEHTKPSYAVTSLNASHSARAAHLNYSLLATVWYQPFEVIP